MSLVDEPDLLQKIEAALILWFNPPLNNSRIKEVSDNQSKCLQVKRVTETVRDFPNLGKKIKQARENDKRSLAEICRQCNISRSYWYQIENEDLRSPVTETIIRKIEAVLNISLGVNFND